MLTPFTVPDWPATSTKSPTLKGRKVRSMTPAAKFENVPWKARAMARPAAPSTATNEAVFTPRTPIEVTTTITMIVTYTTPERNGIRMLSTSDAFSAFLEKVRIQPAKMRPTIRTATAPTTLGAQVTTTVMAWVRSASKSM